MYIIGDNNPVRVDSHGTTTMQRMHPTGMETLNRQAREFAEAHAQATFNETQKQAQKQRDDLNCAQWTSDGEICIKGTQLEDEGLPMPR